jgi:5-methylthioadenosine/S-adenosylhomocysteine deaminase
MEHIDTLITARWVIPIEPGGLVLEHHALAVDRGRIVALLPTGLAAERYAPRERIERPTHVLLPGFVNAHTRAATSLLRGAVEGASFEAWSMSLRRLEQRWIDAEYVRDGTELAIADMLTSGTSCFGDVHLFPEVVAQVASDQRIRACVGLPVADEPSVWAGSADECLAKGLELHDEYRDDPLITTALAPYSPETLGEPTLDRVRRAADELELPIIARLHGRAAPHRGGEHALARLDRLGLLSPLLVAVHALALENDDIERFARAGSSVAHCARATLKLGLGASPAPRLVSRGINVSLGTNGAACNNDLLEELRTAALLARGLPFGDPSPDEHAWLKAATLNGARALGLAEVTGSLVPGKWADLCCIDLGRAQTEPVQDPAAQIVYCASRDQVSDLWVAGRALVSNGRLTHLDLDDVLGRARAWRERIRQSL